MYSKTSYFDSNISKNHLEFQIEKKREMKGACTFYTFLLHLHHHHAVILEGSKEELLFPKHISEDLMYTYVNFFLFC